MPVTYFKEVPSLLPPGGTNYTFFGGANVFSTDAQNYVVDVAGSTYADFIDALTPTTNAWCYGYYWNAYIQAELDDLSAFKMFGSNPNRYSIGHICIADKFAIVDDFVWKFEYQKTRNYRAHFFEGNANPGSFIPDFPTPVDSNLYTYFPLTSSGVNALFGESRAVSLNLFNPLGITANIVVNYYASFVFDASTIVASAPATVVGIFP